MRQAGRRSACRTAITATTPLILLPMTRDLDGETISVRSLTGGLVGGAIAFLTYCLVVVSAPMLLDRRTNVFAAVATSVRAVNANFASLLLWAAIIAVLLLAAAATGFLALVVIFPWLGFASWRAYRDLVDAESAWPAESDFPASVAV